MYSCPKLAPPTNLIPPSLIEGGSGTREWGGGGRERDTMRQPDQEKSNQLYLHSHIHCQAGVYTSVLYIVFLPPSSLPPSFLPPSLPPSLLPPSLPPSFLPPFLPPSLLFLRWQQC